MHPVYKVARDTTAYLDQKSRCVVLLLDLKTNTDALHLVAS